MRKIITYLVLTVLIQTPLFAQAIPILRDMPAIPESAAYQQLRRRPPSELSKMLYLVDRFKAMNIDIQYNSRRLRLKDIVILVNAYILTNFDRKGTARQWVVDHASYSRSKRKPIWVYFPDGSSHLAKDVLLEELNRLEKTMKLN